MVQLFNTISKEHASAITKICHELTSDFKNESDSDMLRNVVELSQQHRNVMRRSKHLCSAIITIILLSTLALAALFGFMTYQFFSLDDEPISALFFCSWSFLSIFSFVKFLKILAVVGDEYNLLLQNLFDLQLSEARRSHAQRNESNVSQENRQKRMQIIRSIIEYFERPAIAKEHCWVIIGSVIDQHAVKKAAAMVIVSLAIGIFPVVLNLL